MAINISPDTNLIDNLHCLTCQKKEKKKAVHAVFGLSTSQCQEIHASERTFSPIFHLAHSVCYKYLDQSGFKRAIKDTQYIVRRSRRHLTEKLQVEVHLHSYKQHLLPWQIYKITNEINCVLIDMKSKKSSFLAWKYMLQKYLKFTKFMLTWCQLGISAHTHTPGNAIYSFSIQTATQKEKQNEFHCISLLDVLWPFLLLHHFSFLCLSVSLDKLKKTSLWMFDMSAVHLSTDL